MSERLQLLWLFVLAAPVACVAWTVTHEEVFKEFHDWCLAKSEESRALVPAEVLLPLHVRILLQSLRRRRRGV